MYRGEDEVDVVYGRENSYRDTTVEALTDYEYHIVTLVARDNVTSDPSDVLKVTTLARLSVPGNLGAAEVTVSSVKLEWTNPNSNIANVQQDIYRDGVLFKGNIGNGFQFTDSSVSSATEYKYKVVVRRGSEVVESNDVSVITVPEAPSDLRETGVTESSVSLTWVNNNNTVLTIYNDIYRDDTFLKTVSGTDTSYIDSQVVAARTYTYTVKARVGDDNRSVASNEVVVVVKSLIPAVTNLEIAHAMSTNVRLEWRNTANNLNEIEHHVYVNGVYSKAVDGKDTKTTVNNLVPGTKNSFFVVTVLKDYPTVVSPLVMS